MEIWKDVKGYEGYYEVSSMGRVRRKPGFVNSRIKNNNKRFVKSHILKANLKSNGYLTVSLSKQHRKKTMLVHRLVAFAFIENDDCTKIVVNHKNCNKQDNRLENLEWVTQKENTCHASRNDLLKTVNRKKIKCKQLNMIFNGSYEAAEYINNKYFGNSKQVKCLASKIRATCTGIQKVAYGFNWEYCI